MKPLDSDTLEPDFISYQFHQTEFAPQSILFIQKGTPAYKNNTML